MQPISFSHIGCTENHEIRPKDAVRFYESNSLFRLLEANQLTDRPFMSQSFVLGNSDIGSWKFLPYPIDTFFDRVLGMDFFKIYSICFDLKNKIAYIGKSS